MTALAKADVKLLEPIVFFGTGPVAAAALQRLTKWAKVEAVITKPQPPQHRGASPVLETAAKLGLPIFTAANKQELEAVFATKPVKSRLAVLVDFGIIVSQPVINYFALGIVNSHFSLLPLLRGADPISFAILEGHPKTGVSLMLIDAGMDTGKLLTQRVHKIAPDATTPSLTEELIELSDELLREYLPDYAAGRLKPRAQPHPGRATYTRRLTKADGQLDFSRPAMELERQIRAFTPWPGSRTQLAGQDITITATNVINGVGEAGQVWQEPKKFGFYTTDGILVVDKLKPAGKPEMTVEAFLAGHKLS